MGLQKEVRPERRSATACTGERLQRNGKRFKGSVCAVALEPCLQQTR